MYEFNVLRYQFILALTKIEAVKSRPMSSNRLWAMAAGLPSILKPSEWWLVRVFHLHRQCTNIPTKIETRPLRDLSNLYFSDISERNLRIRPAITLLESLSFTGVWVFLKRFRIYQICNWLGDPKSLLAVLSQA